MYFSIWIVTIHSNRSTLLQIWQGYLLYHLRRGILKESRPPVLYQASKRNQRNVFLLIWLPCAHRVFKKSSRYSVQVGLSPFCYVVVMVDIWKEMVIAWQFFFFLTCEPSSSGLKSPIICLSSRDVTECAPMASSIPIRDSTEPDENKETIWD